MPSHSGSPSIRSARRARARRAVVCGVAVIAALALAAAKVGPRLLAYADRTSPPWRFVREDITGSRQDASTDLRTSALERYRSRPPRDLSSLDAWPPSEIERRSDELLDSVFRMGASPPVRLPRDLSWREDPFGDRTWRLLLHIMEEYLVPLTERYERSGDLRYLERAEELVLDWIDDNHGYLVDPAHPLSWHDHATALRVRAWLPFWESWRRSARFDPSKAERILRAIISHGERLSSLEFYTESHNHGIDQDVALLAIGIAFPELRDAGRWLELARTRLATQVAATVSARGVHLEHSPGYHIFAAGRLRHAVDLARRHGVSLEPEDLPEIVTAMARAAAQMIRPDGRIVRIGDTVSWPPVDADHPVLGPLSREEPTLRYAITRGREGTPGATFAAYPVAGYAVFRDAWGTEEDFERRFHLFFTAAAHDGLAHKQSDSLSFVLHAGGEPLLEDPGFHSSHSDDPARRFVIDATAHSVVLVDGKGFSGRSARIEGGGEGEGFAFVRGVHEDYPEFRHARTLVHVRPTTVIVVDELRRRDGAAAGPRDFDQQFLLAPRLRPAIGEDRSAITAAPEGAQGPVLRIRQLRDGAGGCTTARGATDPMRGWISLGHMKLEPAPLAAFRARGQEATFVTLIQVLADERELPAPAADEASAEEAGGAVVVRWTEPSGPRECRIRTGPSPAVELGP